LVIVLSSLVLLKKPLHPSVRGAGQKILVSSRLVPRMESDVNTSEQAHDNISASYGRCENGKENEKTQVAREWYIKITP
jgi:hypothetical protein